MSVEEFAGKIIYSRKRLVESREIPSPDGVAAEGGCGVIGFCCTDPISGRHIYEPSRLMHNRGNGKGGGVAAVGFIPEQLGVSREILDKPYSCYAAAFTISSVMHQP